MLAVLELRNTGIRISCFYGQCVHQVTSLQHDVCACSFTSLARSVSLFYTRGCPQITLVDKLAVSRTSVSQPRVREFSSLPSAEQCGIDLLGCDTNSVYGCRRFRPLTLEGTQSFETSRTHPTTQRHIREDLNPQQHR